MTEYKDLPDSEDHLFPIEPRYHPVNRFIRWAYDLFASSKLAMVLLIAILVSCVVGVTVFREAKAEILIFSSLWFNGLLVLLVVNIACCFFGRIWHRKLTLITFGMILFHLSFVAMLGGIVYNSLFSFRGAIRLTEGETLPNGQPQSYDKVESGRFFKHALLKGDIALVQMHTEYKVNGEDKRTAYEIAFREGREKKRGMLYTTHHFDYHGFRYYNDKEGYSVLVVLSDRQGNELYGAHIPLQSLKQKDSSYLYTTGTKEGSGSVMFPQVPEKPLLALQLAYYPTKIKERSGDVFFQVNLGDMDAVQLSKQQSIVKGKVAIGENVNAGKYVFSAKEVRYWVSMNVRYDPGHPIILTSLWVALAGMVITTFGRMFKKGGKRVVEL